MKAKHRILAAGMAAAMTLSLAACGGSASTAEPTASSTVEAAAPEATSEAAGGDVTEVTWWTYFGDKNIGYLQNIIDDFNNSQNQYHVTIVYQGNQMECNAKLQSTEKENLPAMFSGAVEDVAMYANSDFCVPLQKYVDADTEGWQELDDTWDALRSAYSDGQGNLIGYPIGYSYPNIFYNADLLKKAEKRLEIMMSRIIGVNSNCYHGYSIDEALEGIAAAGFHYVELTATKGWTEHVFPDQSFASLCHVQDKLKELDLVPFAMSGHTNLMDADRLPDFIMNMRLAHFFGCKYIVSSIGEAHLKDKAKTGNEVLVQNIKGLIPHLKENGLMLVLELHGEHATGTIMNEIVTAVNSNLVKINYDTANCVFYGNVDAADDIDTCMDNVAYLHIKDKAGARDAWDFPALGKGYVDFKTLFNKLDKANNDAPLSLEIEFTAKGPKDLDEINTAVKESAAYLENLGYKI